jgi:hypothetical protein
MRQRLLPLLACLTLLAACGGGATDPAEAADAGYRALGTRDYASAQEEFEAALEAIGDDTSHPTYVKAKLGAIQTACRTDAARAQTELLDLAVALPDQVTERTYADIAGRLGDAHSFVEAIALLEAGKERFPESATLDGLGKKLVKQAEQAGDSGALDRLSGLGYAGE